MIFRRALIRLTAINSAIVLVLLAAFAVGVYSYVTTAFDFDAVGGVEASGDAADQGFATLRTGLLLCYAVLLIIVPVLSYLMARRTLAPVRASYEAQQRFVDDASHEFRTPLSVVQGELELALMRERTPDEYREAIGGSLDVIHHLTELTGDLLLLARGTRSQIEDAFEDVALSSIIGRAVAAVGRPHPDAATVTIDSAPDITVHGSPELLIRAVANLVENALKFTPPGGTIRIRATADTRHATVEVQDTGIGMTPEQATAAFERFWRGDGSRSARGHGIGLSLVSAIADAHDGRVGIRSAPAAGTVVSLELPRAMTAARAR